MSKLIIASNRLPVMINKDDDGMTIKSSAGGLATGLKSYHKEGNSVWIGWPGVMPETKEEAKEITQLLETQKCLPVFLNEELISNYYDGFSNATLWPLFHYFAEFAEFNETYWQSYCQVNELFANAIIEQAEENDIVWVHDYQLLLLPQILREKRPDLTIGFFLHIPFPSYELIRILPWREKLVDGLLGADLIGFHTYDYARHFISSVKRLLGYDVDFNQIKIDGRQVFIDVFPMGIDFEKFESHALKIQSKPVQERSKEHQDIDRFLLSMPNRKLILSIDRLDYTKGIPQRLHAFRHFLEEHPEYREQVSLIMLTVPSRTDVEQYQNLKNEVDVLVGNINGEFGTLNWNPVIYFYRSVPFENLIELYSSADVALLTPLRDGMNLVAKEYLASKVNRKGVLILSEMAGAAKELGEAISVNPNNIPDTADAIYKALVMSDSESEKAITTMQQRIKRYDIHKWASEFMTALHKTIEQRSEHHARKLTARIKSKIQTEFSEAKSRVLFLDYDGTLQRFYANPQSASPDEELYNLLDKLAADNKTKLVLVSGRDRETFDRWFGNKKYTLIAEHGAWLKEVGKGWVERKPVHTEWKENILPVLESYVDRTPGSLIEEKTYSLVWHYRKADIELGVLRALELVHDISNLIFNQDLEILEGKKVVEIKVSGINKGTAATEFLYGNSSDLIMALGDDWTDEFLFKELPEQAHTIKVGSENSVAKYYLNNYKEVRTFLGSLVKS
ncbi:bifunctional alpha,alpha-trehalose-phosphate synthase (UDP-forming)/trehalose-phosphatase [Draconibacterium sp. IB214405]|uniref:bifunctional alpha,alpha-trehalose-phosphate synthase (UDP-forming)/trehalose-phosphatase n=1 Tax=Draconibacterium sp. IB214405 TaxID=3097352 RepID=UPI002A0FCE3B|nr:bifunctional alpha,alpha-trehalose-phosphate synthase (UDP-forming)/trehalose-phosphatase [Draconibacterium sp. IB214405]MDX8341050.1 bifunctional alpha,alpha-trehalose-phosphate synthase (UDP-forming)/trehalose-phosphatase [Draconibacterium sp. IB214405]